MSRIAYGKTLRIPDRFGNGTVQRLPVIQIRLFKRRMRFEWQVGLFHEAFKARIMRIGKFVQASRQ